MSAELARYSAPTTLTPDVAAPPVAPATALCANCGAEASENYCPRCGQETGDLHRSLAGILGEMLDTFAGWDGKIPRTLWLLVRHPGALTREFFAGRRASYVRPLRLYLTLSVVCFLALGSLRTPDAPATKNVSGVSFDQNANRLIERHRNREEPGVRGWLQTHFARGAGRMREMPKAEQQRVIREGFNAHAPNVVFLLLPVFALLLRVLYLRTPVFYAEHFVFALHNHAFAYLAMAIARGTSVGLAGTRWRALTIIPLLWMPVYFFISMRRAYGGSRLRTLMKFVALSATYGTILFFATIATVLLSIFALA